MPYTWGLLSSLPRLTDDRTARLAPIPGQPPSLINLPEGCVFQPRCEYWRNVPDDRCKKERPALDEVAEGHSIRCFLTDEQRQRFAAERLERQQKRRSGSAVVTAAGEDA
jgi:peptide/nickel transport system ATP-binding protein